MAQSRILPHPGLEDPSNTIVTSQATMRLSIRLFTVLVALLVACTLTLAEAEVYTTLALEVCAHARCCKALLIECRNYLAIFIRLRSHLQHRTWFLLMRLQRVNRCRQRQRQARLSDLSARWS